MGWKKELKKAKDKVKEEFKDIVNQVNELDKKIDDKIFHPIVEALDDSKQCNNNQIREIKEDDTKDKLSLFCSGDLKEDKCSESQHKQEGWDKNKFGKNCCVENESLKKDATKYCSGTVQESCNQNQHIQEGWIFNLFNQNCCIENSKAKEFSLTSMCSGNLKKSPCAENSHIQEGWNAEIFEAYCCIQDPTLDNAEKTTEEKVEQNCSGKLQDFACSTGYHLQEGWILVAGAEEYCCIQNSNLRGWQ